MKIKSVILRAAVLSALFIIIAQPGFGWQKRFGGNGSDTGLCVRQAADNGYIISGSTNSFGAGDLDMYLIKTDAEGNCVWTRTFGGIGPEAGFSCLQTNDGGYIAAGYIEYGVGMSYPSDVYVVKTDADGDCVWTRTFGGPVYDGASSIVQTNDNGYAIAGFSAGDFYLVKTDANGDCAWAQSLGNPVLTDEAYSVKQTSDGGYIMAGETRLTTPSTPNVYLVKTDSNGNKSWDKSFYNGMENARSILQTSDNGYIFTGDFLVSSDMDAGLIKTDVNGDCVWARTFGGSGYDSGRSVQQTVDGGYIIAGETTSFGPGLSDIYLIKTDSNGDCVWAKTFGINGVECMGRSVQQTNDGGYIVTGYVSGAGVSLGVILLKVDANGNDEPLPTPTVTPTFVSCGEGSIAVGVTNVNTGSAGNQLVFTYKNGPVAWDSSPGSGRLKITVPAGWSQPSLVYNDPGNVYVEPIFMVTPSLSINGSDIIVDVPGLKANYGIIVTYGNKSFGGPGAVAPSVPCPAGRTDIFAVGSSVDGSLPCPIASGGPVVNILCLTPTETFTQTPTATPVPTETGCIHRDASFACGGVKYSGNADIAMLGDFGEGMCIDANGKILMTGFGTTQSGALFYINTLNRMFILRLNPDWTYDTTFGGGTGKFAGVPGTLGSDIAVTAGGKIIVAGKDSVFRFNPDGTLDTSFGTGGVFTWPMLMMSKMAIDTYGRIVVTGQDQGSPTMMLLRLDQNGNPDLSFNGTGKAVFPVGNGFGVGVAIDSSGRIYVTGNISYTLGDTDMLLCRYLDNGTLDTSFNGTGYLTYNYNMHDIGFTVVLDSAGKIVVAGDSSGPTLLYDRLLVWRYNTDGTPDTTFNGNGIVSNLTGSIGTGIVFDADGNIIIAGADASSGLPTLALWKLSNSGGLINEVVSTIPSASTGSNATAIKRDASGRLIVAGGLYRNVAEDKEAAVWVYDDSCVAIPTPTVTPTQVIAATPTITATPDIWHGKCVRVINNVMHPVKGDRIRLMYRVEKDSKVTIKVCDRNGKFLTSLVDENKTPGDYDLQWDGNCGNGKTAGSGMYVITIKINDFTAIEKAAVIR
jgi:uncharacterized delta-60 repeat protein